MNRFFYATLVIFTFSAAVQADPAQLRLALPLSDEVQLAQTIQQTFSDPFILEDLTFESDVTLSQAEFNYLVDLPKGEQIAAAQIQKAVSYLIKKNRFEQIELVVKQGQCGKQLHWMLTGLWSFDRLNITGILLGKDAYRYLYMLEHGQPFEREKHRLSLQKIKEAFAYDGYFNGQVKDEIIKDAPSKSIKVNLMLNRGERFVMYDVQILWLEVEHLPLDVLVEMQHQVKKQFVNKLINKYYQQKIINKATKELNQLLAHEGFLDVGIELEKQIDHLKNKVTLVFTINLHKKKPMVFIGNHFFSKAQLLDAIVIFGRSAALLPSSILAQEIAHRYHTKGFWSVSLQAAEEQDRFVFVIDEGARVCVDDIIFKGIKAFDTQQLAVPFFKQQLKQLFYDELLIKQSIDKLLAYYLQQGFLKAKVLRQEFVPAEEENHYRLELTLDEGDRTYLTRISIEGFPELLKSGPFERFNKPTLHVPFDPAIIVEQNKFLQRRMGRQRYNAAHIHHELMRQGDAVQLTWKIDRESSQNVSFGKTVVVGDCRLPFEYIKRELQYQEGDAWDKEKLKQSLLRLRTLDLFEQIHLYPYQPAVVEPEKTVLLKVCEDDPFEVRLRGGLGLQQVGKHYVLGRGVTFAAGIGLVGKSPLNIGDQIRFDADFTRSYRKINGCYSIPWLFNQPIRTLFKVYSNKYFQPTFIESTKNLYDVTQEGFLVSFARKYKVYDGAFALGIEWMETDLKNADPDICALANQLAQAISFTPQLADKKVPFFQFEPTLFIDYLDDRLNPTYGSLTLFSCKGMVPLKRRFSDVYFFKLLIEQSLFFPFGLDVVGGLRIRVGHIFSANFNNVMPLERFYLGGAHSIRSYDVDLCPPVGLFHDAMNKAHIVPQGGQTMVNANFELRFPLFKGLGGVVFQDIGTLVGGEHQQSFDAQSLLAGTGFGLRYNTPIGPLRFDIAFKWKRRDASESSYAWFLSMGHAF